MSHPGGRPELNGPLREAVQAMELHELLIWDAQKVSNVKSVRNLLPVWGGEEKYRMMQERDTLFIVRVK